MRLQEAHENRGTTLFYLEELASARLHLEQGIALEVYRVQGELLLLQATPDALQAETSFQHALDIARRQQAQSWEFRAGHEPVPAVATPGQTRPSSSDARSVLWLVYRGF